MGRILAEASFNGHGSAMSSELGLFLLCVASAVMAVVIFNCGRSNKRRTAAKKNGVAYYGGGAPVYTPPAASKSSGSAAKVAVGAAVGVVAGSLITQDHKAPAVI
ncbi:hypothetical protein ZIOFF_028705 [Zingiber officinale]|uniref:Uncharacterized protein n=1 Tax=Zingiber officinale TaxID=94328 RepID=A0A8J5GLN7_ZINOF|nr:hypothetical protein ZIOFF_028705 [Zingiber officinale]